MRCVTFFLLLTLTVSACAATVQETITGGVADLTFAGQQANENFAVSGARFSFTGAGVVSASVCSPLVPCMPGDRIDAGFAALSSEDRGVAGVLTIQGRSHTYTEGPGAPGGAGISYDFNFSTPAANPPATLTLTGPFTATANFADPDIESGNEFHFDGSGSVTISLTFIPEGELGPAQYLLQNAHFAFANVPEPGTGMMALAVLSLIFIVSARVHRGDSGRIAARRSRRASD
jgi:hypothetical protein